MIKENLWKKKDAEKKINNIIYLYIILFVLYSFSGRILPIALFIGDRINSVIYALFAGVGCILVVVDYFVSGKIVKSRHFGILCVYVFVMVCSSIINIKLGYIENIKTIIWTIIQITLFYSVYLRFDKKNISNILSYSFGGISAVWTLGVLISLIQFIIQDVYFYDITGREYQYQGFYANRLFGIFNDPNFAAVTSGYVIFMLIYLYNKNRHKWHKMILFFLMIVLNALYVLLAGSRTAEIGILCASFILLFLNLRNRFFANKHSFFYASVGAILILVCIVGVSLPVKTGLTILPKKYVEKYASEIGHIRQDKILQTLLRGREDVLIYWQKSSLVENKASDEQIKKSTPVEQEKKQEDIVTEQDDKAESLVKRKDIQKGNISANRVEIWKEYLQGMKGRYLCGTSPRNMLKYLEKSGMEGIVLERKYETHNGYLSLLVGCGILGCIPVLVFAFLTGKRICMYCFGKKKIAFEFTIVFSIISLILIYTVFFTELFFVNNLTTSLFWSGLGILWLWLEE